jgi:hypothetical protein
VEHIFGNPGTTESPLLDALSTIRRSQYIVHLHEGVAVGAASYYARTTGRTGVANLHVAPGLGNGIGMIYNALKANAPIVVTAGQQDTRMLRREPILSRTTWPRWRRRSPSGAPRSSSADEMDEVMRRAFKVANDPPYGPVFVSLPIDVMAQDTAHGRRPAPPVSGIAPDPLGVAAACGSCWRAAREPVIVVGDEVGRAGAIGAARGTGRTARRAGVVRRHPRPRVVPRRASACACRCCPSTRPPSARRWAAPIGAAGGRRVLRRGLVHAGPPFPEAPASMQVETSPRGRRLQPRRRTWRWSAPWAGARVRSTTRWRAGDDDQSKGRRAAAAPRWPSRRPATSRAYQSRLEKAWARCRSRCRG